MVVFVDICGFLGVSEPNGRRRAIHLLLVSYPDTTGASMYKQAAGLDGSSLA